MRDFRQPFAIGPVVLLVALVITAPHVHSQPASDLPWMTGERLVKLMGSVDQRSIHWTPESPFPNRAIAAEYRDMVNGEFVHGYIQAVHDASEGREWCWTNSKPKPHTLIEDTRRHLQQLPHAELRSNAAALIVEHWRKRFPCSTKAERRPK